MSPLSNKNLEKVFDECVTEPLKKPSNIHWTPFKIIEKAVSWLGENEKADILDIGSGIGKFCIVGAQISKATFTGIELRSNLVKEAAQIAKKLNVSNVSFINDDITNIGFEQFDAFYFYNPFGEHIAVADWIDKTIDFSEKQLFELEKYVFEQLEKKQKGTKVVTYCSPNFYLPNSYFAKEILDDGDLVFWEKKH